MKKTKTFKTLDEQVEILKNKGLIIEDEEKAKEILFRENYFFISGYRHLFMKSFKDSTFIKGTTFDELYSTFQFDRNLRNIMFKHLLIIENNVKSIFSYTLSKKYGFKEKDYLNPKNFTQDKLKNRQVYDVINKMKRQIRVNGKQHGATSHYMDNYGYIPLWIGVKVISFGLISEMFSILKEEDKFSISSVYKIEPEEMETYLPILANYRNLCAHEDVTFDHFTQRMIPDTKYHSILNIQKIDGEYINGKNDIFALIIILKRLLTDVDFKMMMNEINYELDRLSGKLNSIKIDDVIEKMGFPSNYKDIMYLD